jgi:hypothetical protein
MVKQAQTSGIGLVMFALLMTACSHSPEAWPTGNFADDYGITYSITDSTWSQQPGSTYQIAEVLEGERSLILKQPATDSTAALWTRVDWMLFDDMDPWKWGYCYSGWDLASMDAALSTPSADRSTPLTGCGDFPFSRMRTEP